jgi:hypothetical protein
LREAGPEDVQSVAGEELADAGNAVASELPHERAPLQRERERLTQSERRVASLVQELKSSSQGREGQRARESLYRNWSPCCRTRKVMIRTEAEAAAALWEPKRRRACTF